MRPKTLAAGSVPVIVASALAYSAGCFQLVPALLCLVFALLSQIASNFSNDYFDYKNKTDDEMRLGPARAVSSGWIAPNYMLVGTAIDIALACAFGLCLIYYGGWWLIAVGVVCVLSLLAYTAGPYPLSYHGLGDVFVLVFFGWVAVVFSYYVQAKVFCWQSLVAGTSVGLGAVNILILNNYRDYENDKASCKHTTIVLFGKKYGEYVYLINGFVAVGLCFLFWKQSSLASLLPLFYLPFHVITWRTMCKIGKGRSLNSILGMTSRNLLIFGILLSIGLIAPLIWN